MSIIVSSPVVYNKNGSVRKPLGRKKVYVRPCTKYPTHGIKACVAKKGDTSISSLIAKKAQKKKSNKFLDEKNKKFEFYIFI
ncbi:hypothetical protein BpHYR1_006156 [Brachionus plicatilis]|uniref:Uncharacterized protein n=1 Tax=Brachionus plicatilis TaxID=10195 RepID=A0A3M7RAG7_BRAPC|nr:hypothetical protein BpHYR1_006156 [Brachionus plicatilis]